MEAKVAKIICEKTINGVTAVRNITTPWGNQGSYVKTIVEVGNKFPCGSRPSRLGRSSAPTLMMPLSAAPMRLRTIWLSARSMFSLKTC